MAEDRLPDLSPTALGRLVAGMTPAEVEAVVGPYHRPNVYRGRRYYAWIGEGAMLRAFFDGPGGTLAAAVLDVPEGQRRLDLGRGGQAEPLYGLNRMNKDDASGRVSGDDVAS